MKKSENPLSDIGGYIFNTDELSFNMLVTIWETGGALQKDIEDFLVPFKISHGRFSILLTLYKHQGKPVYPSEIASALKKKRPTITGMLKKLIQNGLASEVTDSLDERKKLVRLEHKGFKLLEEIIPLYNRRIQNFTKNLLNEEKQQLIKLISKINLSP